MYIWKVDVKKSHYVIKYLDNTSSMQRGRSVQSNAYFDYDIEICANEHACR